MAVPSLLGIDVGTSSCKAGLYSPAGELLAGGSARYPVARPAPGHLEQEPEDWWRGAMSAIGQIVATPGVDARSISAIGLCGQSPTSALLGEDGTATCPAILWQDTRAAAECDVLWETSSPDERRDWFGLDLPPSSSWPAAHLLWLRRHRLGVLSAARVLLQPKDVVGLRLTGEACSDRWTMRGLVNVRTGQLHPGLIARLGIDRALVPSCPRPFDIAGRVTTETATLTGIPQGIPVAAGWADGLCGILGAGALSARFPGAGFIISGSSEVAGICGSDTGAPSPGVLRAPVYEGGRAFVFGPTQCSGDAVDWLGRLLRPDSDPATRSALQAAALARPHSGLIFLPYLAGERAPVWDTSARGAFYGLTLGSTAADLLRAALEGIAFSNRHVLDTATAVEGTKLAAAIIAGGGAKSPDWNQLRADLLGVPLHTCASPEGGTLGAAILAAVAAGLYPSLAAASDAMVRHAETYLPDAGKHAHFEPAYRMYTRLYPALIRKGVRFS